MDLAGEAVYADLAEDDIYIDLMQRTIFKWVLQRTTFTFILQRTTQLYGSYHELVNGCLLGCCRLGEPQFWHI